MRTRKACLWTEQNIQIWPYNLESYSSASISLFKKFIVNTVWQPSPNIARWNMSMGDASSLQFPQFLSLGVKKETESKDLCKIYMWWCSSLSVSFSKQLALLMDTVTHIYFYWGNCFQFLRMSEAIHVISTRSEIQFGSYQLNAF